MNPSPADRTASLAAIATRLARSDRLGALEATAAAILALEEPTDADIAAAEAILATPELQAARRPHTADLLGQCALRRGALADAAAHLRRGFDWQPDNAALAARLIDTLTRLGRGTEADEARIEHEALIAEAITRLPPWTEAPRAAATAQALYLDLLEKAVANWFYGDGSIRSGQPQPFDRAARGVGRDLPLQAHSMIGLRRLRQLRCAAETAILESVPGDFLEAGVWRGGACILLRGVLAAHQVSNRSVIVADSFAGLPPPDPRYSKDAATLFDFHTRPELSVSLDAVRENFALYGLLDTQVEFLPGLFKDTLPSWGQGRQLAILRLDGDLYSSTMDTLHALYDRVAPGGFIISDDYGVVVDARRAVLDFRRLRGIAEPMQAVDGDAVVWRKPLKFSKRGRRSTRPRPPEPLPRQIE